jgi:EspA/EspE family
VSALDAFMSTWSTARQTLGQGTPQDGAPFDNSAQLRSMQTTVASAAPGQRWTGLAADVYGDANTKQGQVLGRMAVLDQRLGVEVDRSAAVVSAGRQNLDGVKQWVLDAAASVPPGDDREQQLLPIARKGIGDVADVVKQTNGDLNAIGARIRTIGNQYKELGGDKNGGGPNDKDPLDKIVGKDEPYDTGSDIRTTALRSTNTSSPHPRTS